VRATHAKTIELTTEPAVTERATCIVAVAADLDPARLAQLEGPVVVTLEAGGRRDEVRGVANARYDAATGRLVIRRSHHRAADTLVVGADKGSADLDRALVAALADGRAELRVTVAPDTDDIAAADAPLVLDADLAAAQHAAARVATVLGGDVHVSHVTFAGVLPRRAAERRRALRRAEPALTVWQVRPQDVVAVAADLAGELVAVVTDVGTPDERVHRAADEGAFDRATTAFVVVREGAARGVDERLVDALVAAGVPARTIQDALTSATGVARREAYEHVVRARDRGRA
jgi:hypothetical protein